MIYLDYNATTPVGDAAAAAMLPFLAPGLGGAFANPSSTHCLATKTRAALLEARARVSSLISAHPDEITFVSGGTESINSVLKGLALAHWRSVGRQAHIVSSVVEHIAVTATLKWLSEQGLATYSLVGVDATGVVDSSAVAAALTADTVCVSIMLANNETGALQPIAAISAAVKRAAEALGLTRPVAIHTDASQAVGKVPVDVCALGVDVLTIAGHKLYAPKGIGATYVRAGFRGSLPAFMHGAGQEGGARAGTENVAYAAALGAACDEAAVALGGGYPHSQAALRDRLALRLLSSCSSEVGITPVVHGPLAARLSSPSPSPADDDATRDCLPNTLYISFPGAFAADLLASLRDTLACSAGAACHSPPPRESSAASSPVDFSALAATAHPSHVLSAMGVPRQLSVCTLRLSVGRWTTDADVDAAVPLIVAAVAEARARVGLSKPQPANVHSLETTPAPASDAPAAAAAVAAASLPLVTAPLFLEDTYRFSCGACTVLRALPSPQPASTPASPSAPAFPALVLDATVAHPQGGGQPADRGVIALSGPGLPPRLAFTFHMVKAGSGPELGRAVLHYGRFTQLPEGAQDDEGALAALADAVPEEGASEEGLDVTPAFLSALPGCAAAVHISRPHRVLAARLHSAGHVLDQAVKRVYADLASAGHALEPLVPGKGFHFASGPYVEYVGAVPPAWRDKLPQLLTDACAALIAEAAPTRVVLVSKEDAAALAEAGLAPADCAHLPDGAPVRVVAVGGANNTCPCGGTHVRHTGELRSLTVRSVKVAKGRTSVKYVVGADSE